jgi:hypothetical protein
LRRLVVEAGCLLPAAFWLFRPSPPHLTAAFCPRPQAGAVGAAPTTAPPAAAPTPPAPQASPARRCSSDAVRGGGALAHWGMEFDGLDFFETLIPGPCPLPSH